MKTFNISTSLVKTSTLSPNGLYYYKLRNPESLNPSAFGCSAVFYNTTSNEVLYYNSKALLHELHSKSEIMRGLKSLKEIKSIESMPKDYSLEFVWWSVQGNVCYFLEYTITENQTPKYESVFLNCREKYCYRIDETMDNSLRADDLNLEGMQFDEELIIRKLESHGLNRYDLIVNNLSSKERLLDFIGIKKWLPKG